jgi:26S proteasome regulatory subunit N12
MPSLEQLTNDLKQAFESHNHVGALKLLPQIQILLVQNSLLVPDLKQLEDVHYVGDLLISRAILEIGALCAINCRELEKFENLVLQLRAFYFNQVGNAQLSKSGKKNKILSLYLLLLLSKGDVVRFHSELEFLNQNIKNIDNDLYLNYPIKIENWVLEGYYDKAVELIKDTDSEEKQKLREFNIFDETLLQAIRFEISRSIEKSYKSLPFSNAKYLLFLNSEKEVESWAKEQSWTIKKNELIFNSKSENPLFNYDDEDSEMKPSERLVKNTLNYAREIDSII